MTILKIDGQPIHTFTKVGTVYPISRELRDYLTDCHWRTFEDDIYCDVYSDVLFEECLNQVKDNREEYGLSEDDVEDLKMLDKIAKDERITYIQLETSI